MDICIKLLQEIESMYKSDNIARCVSTLKTKLHFCGVKPLLEVKYDSLDNKIIKAIKAATKLTNK